MVQAARLCTSPLRTNWLQLHSSSVANPRSRIPTLQSNQSGFKFESESRSQSQFDSKANLSSNPKPNSSSTPLRAPISRAGAQLRPHLSVASDSIGRLRGFEPPIGQATSNFAPSSKLGCSAAPISSPKSKPKSDANSISLEHNSQTSSSQSNPIRLVTFACHSSSCLHGELRVESSKVRKSREVGRDAIVESDIRREQLQSSRLMKAPRI